MTKRTPVRVSLRTILLGSAALGFATALSLPAWDGAGGLGIAYAQNQTTHGQGAGRQGGSEAGHASSGGGGSSTTHGAGMGGGHDATAPSNADSGGSGVAGGSDASGTSGASGGSDQAAGHGHFGQGGSTGAVTSDEGTSTDKKGPRFGGGTGGEHFVHDSTGYWGADGKILRR